MAFLIYMKKYQIGILRFRINMKQNVTFYQNNRIIKSLWYLTPMVAFRLSRLFTQITESISPTKTERILTPAQTERTPSVSVILNKTGIKVISGKTLITNAATLNFCNFLFSIMSPHFFFPKAYYCYSKYQYKDHNGTWQKWEQIKPGT